ncbi:hypothetical protein ES703_83635 [subsurface metagenome]
MGKLTAMPQLAIISGFKGVVDFYVYMGIPCFRAWPKSPGKKRTPAVMAWWAPFATAAKEWKLLSPYVRRSCEIMAGHSGLSGKDVFTRGYMKGLYRNPLP